MVLTNKERVVEVVERHGEIGVAGLHEVLTLDKGTARKVALEAVREGRIGARNNGNGYVFYATGRQPIPNRLMLSTGQSANPYSEPIEDLVPVRQPDGMIVHQLRDGRTNRLRRIPNEWLQEQDGGHFDGAPQNDPDDWIPQPAVFSRQTGQQSSAKSQSRAVTVAPPPLPQPTWGDIVGAMAAISAGLLTTHQNLAKANAEARKQAEPSGGSQVRAVNEQAAIEERDAWKKVDPENLTPEDEGELDELISDYWQRREDEAANPSKYETQSWQGDDGMTHVQLGSPRARPLPRRAVATMRNQVQREEQAERLAKEEARRKAAEFLTGRRSKTEPEPPKPKSWVGRLKEQLTAPPKPPVWG